MRVKGTFLAAVATAATALMVSVAGCSAGIDSAQRTTSLVTLTTAPTTPTTSPVQISPERPAVWPDSPMCIVSANLALQRRLAHVWAPPRSAGIEAFVAKDAPTDIGWMFSEERGKYFAGVSLWNIKTGEQRRVHKFADPQNYQAGGSFDGRYLLWGESHSMEGASYVSIYSYDIQTGKVRHLADQLGDTRGMPYPGLSEPVSSGGTGAWVQGIGPGVSALKLVDLRTGQIRTVRRGSFGSVQFVGDKLVIAEPKAQRVHLIAVDVHSLKEVALPSALPDTRNVASFAASPDGKIAYIDDTFQQLWFSSGPDRAPTLVAQLPAEFGFQGALEMSDIGLIYSSQGHGSYFIDVTTGSAVKITGGGYFFLRGSHVVTVDANSDKSAKITTLRIFDLAAGAIPACPKTPAPLHTLAPSTAPTQPSEGTGA